jgi:hypothetical protein
MMLVQGWWNFQVLSQGSLEDLASDVYHLL